MRYYYPYDGITAEFDAFEGELAGLVLVDFEFDTEEEMAAFIIPGFCLADVTQEAGLAGGVLAGRSYGDITVELAEYNYRTLLRQTRSGVRKRPKGVLS
ncbi:MAG: hypothetical protein U1A28_02815 [Patescibacteria group bacterium]|nr:hypothetical protein [Patescibacteria group bacterium]